MKELKKLLYRSEEIMSVVHKRNPCRGYSEKVIKTFLVEKLKDSLIEMLRREVIVVDIPIKKMTYIRAELVSRKFKDAPMLDMIENEELTIEEVIRMIYFILDLYEEKIISEKLS